MNEKSKILELWDIYYQSWFKINDIYHTWSMKQGIHETTLFVLYVINETSHNCTQNEICNKLYLPKQTVSLILSGLEKKGYIYRELHPEDRRNKIVKLTESGSKFSNDILSKLKIAEMEALNNMTIKQRQALSESFCLLSDSLYDSLSK